MQKPKLVVVSDTDPWVEIILAEGTSDEMHDLLEKVVVLLDAPYLNFYINYE